MASPTSTGVTSTPGPLAVLGSQWTEDGCLVRVRRPGETSVLVPVVGLELRYRIDADGPRHCVGHHSPKRNDGRYLECLNQPRPSEKTCVRCAVADAEFAADLHHAHTRSPDEIHQSVLHHLQRTNVLYLAAFRDGSVKVGTSTGGRRHTRLVEQGAWVAVEAAEVVDGFAVRHLEDLVTEALGLPQAIATSRKLKGMTSPRSDHELERTLTDHLGHVHRLMDDEQGREIGGATPTERWWRSPEADQPGWQRPIRYPLALDQGSHHVIIGAACGRLVNLARPGGTDHFVDDLGRLYGRELELGAFEPDQLLVQDSLF